MCIKQCFSFKKINFELMFYFRTGYNMEKFYLIAVSEIKKLKKKIAVHNLFATSILNNLLSSTNVEFLFYITNFSLPFLKLS